jgi:hypothetical protein
MLVLIFLKVDSSAVQGPHHSAYASMIFRPVEEMVGAWVSENERV